MTDQPNDHESAVDNPSSEGYPAVNDEFNIYRGPALLIQDDRTVVANIQVSTDQDRMDFPLERIVTLREWTVHAEIEDGSDLTAIAKSGAVVIVRGPDGYEAEARCVSISASYQSSGGTAELMGVSSLPARLVTGNAGHCKHCQLAIVRGHDSRWVHLPMGLLPPCSTPDPEPGQP